ncbi:bacteriochlorophyll 4-vinyl reductase [Oscillochloris sp. ZM17-4]|uniref:bacteriochlorophyll 4-vinyl reductase n=1 Tax=Oscillochloris sp. ZM17-4 TaxID=2866714 RepID=UPI001C73BF60|nr:bacteriochlorophyll 4-vinyl reductase [Oscillochloris sp. ZM17-4]MBX0328063.1 bacteriochlorophyll 4-vinyl reductase [Oscillochloris sp. ZM17-4]
MVATTMHVARIGPNAIIQTIAALRESYAPEELPALLAGDAAGYLSELPHAMIPESDFHDLVRLLVARMGGERAGEILYRSGERTADYVRANRIPAPIRTVLGLLPAPISLRLLLLAISKHAWTFVGSGVFRFGLGRAPSVSIGRPDDQRAADISGALCRYYSGAFTQMLRRVVSQRIDLRETACQSHGGDACVYQIVL